MLYGKLQQAVRMLSGEQQQALTITESISQALRISGASANEMQSALLRLGQALAACSAANRTGLAWRPALWLDFGTHPCGQPQGTGGFSVPILKVYFMSNSVDAVRLPGREPIPAKSLRLSVDEGSWAWGLSASLPYRALEMVEPTASGPVEIEIAINGVAWVMLVEGFDVRREFGQARLDIRGRSTAAYLAAPYAPKRSFIPAVPFASRQLTEQELTRAGLMTGFALDWRLPD